MIVLGITDRAFKGIQTVDELLEKTPPKGWESWTLQWREEVLNLPVFRMVHSDGLSATAALTFSSIQHDFTSLSQQACFQNTLRIHGIRGGVANAVDHQLFPSLLFDWLLTIPQPKCQKQPAAKHLIIKTQILSWNISQSTNGLIFNPVSGTLNWIMNVWKQKKVWLIIKIQMSHKILTLLPFPKLRIWKKSRIFMPMLMNSPEV